MNESSSSRIRTTIERESAKDAKCTRHGTHALPSSIYSQSLRAAGENSERYSLRPFSLRVATRLLEHVPHIYQEVFTLSNWAGSANREGWWYVHKCIYDPRELRFSRCVEWSPPRSCLSGLAIVIYRIRFECPSLAQQLCKCTKYNPTGSLQAPTSWNRASFDRQNVAVLRKNSMPAFFMRSLRLVSSFSAFAPASKFITHAGRFSILGFKQYARRSHLA